MEREDSEVEDGFPGNVGRWQPDREGLIEGTSNDTTRWLPSYKPASRSSGDVCQSATEALSPSVSWAGSDNPQTQKIGRRHRDNPAKSQDCANRRGLGTRFAKKSSGRTNRGACESHTAESDTRKTKSPKSHEELLQNHGADRNGTLAMDGPDGTAVRGISSPLSELCAGTIALCSLYYVRLKKERQLRDSERRRRHFLFRRSKARERLRFAAMWAYGLLSGKETPSGGQEEQESRVWGTAIDKAFSRFDWIESFRVTKPTFDFLCNQLRPVFQRMDAGARRSIPAEVRLAVTLWHLGSSCDFRTMERIFRLSCSTICTIVRDVCEAVASVLAPKVISVPQGVVLRETLRGFERRYGLAQVAGVIGTLHVAIGSPKESTGQFYNTKGWHSVVLQAVVDPDFCFWDLNVGCPGGLSDSQVLVASELYERGTEGTLFPHTTKNINGIEVPVHLLGSRSYPLLPWLMTPVTEESSAVDVELNRRFTSALTLTQIAFGRLKSRWRCLLKCSHVDLSFLPILVTACCTLHNICEGRREPFEDHWLEEASEEELEQPSEVEEDDLEIEGAAEEIRTALASGVRA